MARASTSRRCSRTGTGTGACATTSAECGVEQLPLETRQPFLVHAIGETSRQFVRLGRRQRAAQQPVGPQCSDHVRRVVGVHRPLIDRVNHLLQLGPRAIAQILGHRRVVEVRHRISSPQLAARATAVLGVEHRVVELRLFLRCGLHARVLACPRVTDRVLAAGTHALVPVLAGLRAVTSIASCCVLIEHRRRTELDLGQVWHTVTIDVVGSGVRWAPDRTRIHTPRRLHGIGEAVVVGIGVERIGTVCTFERVGQPVAIAVALIIAAPVGVLLLVHQSRQIDRGRTIGTDLASGAIEPLGRCGWSGCILIGRRVGRRVVGRIICLLVGGPLEVLEPHLGWGRSILFDGHFALLRPTVRAPPRLSPVHHIYARKSLAVVRRQNLHGVVRTHQSSRQRGSPSWRRIAGSPAVRLARSRHRIDR